MSKKDKVESNLEEQIGGTGETFVKEEDERSEEVKLQ
jgi:hypothetical protein